MPMALGSKKGACSSNTQAAKGGCLYHNRRTETSEKVPGYVNKELSHCNRTVFEDDAIKDRKTLTPLVKQAQKLYTEKTGQKCQKSFTPYRESVVVIKEDTTDDQLKDFARRVEQRTGWKCMGIWVHLDEGHKDHETGEFKRNTHAHVLWRCQNLNTGKGIAPTLRNLQGMQDDLAAATGMERGNPTGKRHLNVIEQRIRAEEESLRRTKEEQKRAAAYNGKLIADAERQRKEILQGAQQEKEQLQQEIKDAKEERKEIERKAMKGAKVSAANAITAIGQTITSKLGLNKAQNELNQLKANNPKELAEQTRRAHEKGISEGRTAAVREAMKAAGLKFGDKRDNNPTPQDIGKAWRGNFNTKTRLIENFKYLLDKNQGKGYIQLADKIIEGMKKGYFNNDDDMIMTEYVTPSGFKQTKIIEKPITRKTIKSMFDKLCKDTDPQKVAEQLTLCCVYDLSKEQLQWADGMLNAFARDSKKKQEETKQQQKKEQKQDWHYGRGMGL